MNIYNEINEAIKKLRLKDAKDEAEQEKIDFAVKTLNDLFHNLKFKEELEEFKYKVKENLKDKGE